MNINELKGKSKHIFGKKRKKNVGGRLGTWPSPPASVLLLWIAHCFGGVAADL